MLATNRQLTDGHRWAIEPKLDGCGEAPLAYVVFDLPHLAGEPTIGLTYRDRRRLLELLELNGPAWCTVPTFDAAADEVLEECARLRLEGAWSSSGSTPGTSRASAVHTGGS
jgi:ATP-dependent DNA ligase